MVNRLLIIFIFWVAPWHLMAQTDEIIEVAASAAESNAASESIEPSIQIVELMENRIDLNRCNYEELTASGLLSLHQIDMLLNHRKRFGPLLSLHELQVVEGFHPDEIIRIMPYCFVGTGIDLPQGGIPRLLREGTHQLMARVSFIPEEKSGYINRYDRPAYEGGPAGIYMRYRFDAGGRIRWGITAEKDPGEAFFTGSRKDGFDFYSCFLNVRDMGRVKMFSAGDYTLSYGQGLVFSSGSRGLSSDPCMVLSLGTGIRPYGSAGESGFLRGGAISLEISKKLLVDLFFSHTKRDANVDYTADSTNLFTSLQTSGLHRTWYEIADRKQVRERIMGTALRYDDRHIKWGLVATSIQYDRPYQKSFEYYNQFDFSGTSNPMVGVFANGLVRNVNLFGEVAVDGRLNKGLLAGVVAMLGPKAGVVMLLRDYDIGFYNPHGGAFGASYRNNAERGLMFGLTARPSKPWTISMMIDKYQFKWLRYGVSAPSHGYKVEANISYKPDRKSELSVRLRKSLRMEDGIEFGDQLVFPKPKEDIGVRIQLISAISKSISLRTRVEKKSLSFLDENESGFLFFQDIIFKPMASPFTWNFRYANFDTDGYDSRVYAYENDVLYGYSIPALYYRGTRIYANLQYKTKGNLTIWLRYAVTWYANRDAIGSGYEAIQGNRKSEVKLQLRIDW